MSITHVLDPHIPSLEADIITEPDFNNTAHFHPRKRLTCMNAGPFRCGHHIKDLLWYDQEGSDGLPMKYEEDEFHYLRSSSGGSGGGDHPPMDCAIEDEDIKDGDLGRYR